MKDYKIGQLVKLPGIGSRPYVVESGKELGQFVLIPITVDNSRETLDLTPELKQSIQPY